METSKTTLRFADLPNRADTTFAIEPDAAQRAEIAKILGIPAIRKLRRKLHSFDDKKLNLLLKQS